MISDDNFNFFQVTEIVEYIVSQPLNDDKSLIAPQ